MRDTRAAPPSLYIVAIPAIAWNLVGIVAFILQFRMSATQMAALPPAEQQVWRAMPGWAWAVYATAVSSGTAGAIALLLRSRAAVPLLALSLGAVLLQYGYSFLVARIATTLGPQAALLPGAIVVLAIGQAIYARHAARRGRLG